MAVEKKRPRGLKGSAKAKANKKSKVDETPSEIPENAQTVVIDKVVEEGDEVGEAAALYESAIEKLGKFSRVFFCLSCNLLTTFTINNRNRRRRCFTFVERYHSRIRSYSSQP